MGVTATVPILPGAAVNGETLEFLQLAIMDLEPGNDPNFTHRFLLLEAFGYKDSTSRK